MKKLVLSLIALSSLIPSTSVRANETAEEQTVLAATDKDVLGLFGKKSEDIAIVHVKLMQKSLNQAAHIKKLEATVDERSFTEGTKKGFAIGVVLAGLSGFAVGYMLGYRSAASNR